MKRKEKWSRKGNDMYTWGPNNREGRCQGKERKMRNGRKQVRHSSEINLLFLTTLKAKIKRYQNR